MYYIGLMSGTSMDAIDCALVSFKDNKTNLISYAQYPLDEDTKKRVRKVNARVDVEEVDQLDETLGYLFANATNTLILSSGIDKKEITAVGSHGQTVLHEPNAPEPFSLQIANPNIIANETGILTIADFRNMDIAAGGQGAPLAPAFHEYKFRHPEKNRVVLNIGGMANITVLPSNPDIDVIGFDTGPGNALMDDWSRKYLNADMDKYGQWAASGQVDQNFLNEMLNDDYFRKAPPKSTGIEYFNLDWIDCFGIKIKPENMQATLLALSTQTITQAIQAYSSNTNEVLVCGGGIHNDALMQTLRDHLPSCDVVSTKKFNLDPDCIEAVTFAWLAKQRIENKPANLPSVTGARHAVLLGEIFEPS